MTSRVFLGLLLAFQGLIFSSSAIAQDRPSAETTSNVRDAANVFSIEAVRQANEALQKVERETGIAATIETVESLKGEAVDDAAIRLARQTGLKGIFVLIAKKETKIDVIVSREHREAFTDTILDNLRNAFSTSFRKRDFDGGLRDGVAAIAAAAATSAATPSGEKPTAKADEARLIVRNQVRLTLEGARAILAGATKQAAAMKLVVNIAVVDEGGHLLAFERMNGARPASGYTAITKAATAATFRQATGPIPAGAENPDPLLNLSLQNAAQASGGKFTSLRGGVPIVIDGQVIGGVGVGGGTGEQDAEVAQAGIDAFLQQLKTPAEEPKDAPAKPAEAPKTEPTTD